jgi:predicted transposase/invertase (TIGR01784 family)
MSSKENNDINISHDGFFKKSMEKPKVAREFFESHLPKHILERADLSTLKPEKDSFIDIALGTAYVDMLFSVNIDKEIGYFYLLAEHQSNPDYWMAFRLHKYMLRIYDSHLQKYPDERHLPLIYPMVFYSGTRNYNAPLDLWGLFKNPELAKKYFVDPFQLIELQKIPDEALKQKLWCGVMEFIMKHIYERDILPFIENIDDLLSSLAKEDIDYIKVILCYTAYKGESNSFEEVVKTFSKTVPDNRRSEIMTIAESLVQKGRMEGRTEGRMEGRTEGRMEGRTEGIQIMLTATNLLNKGMTVDFVAETTGLSLKEVLELKSNIEKTRPIN